MDNIFKYNGRKYTLHFERPECIKVVDVQNNHAANITYNKDFGDWGYPVGSMSRTVDKKYHVALEKTCDYLTQAENTSKASKDKIKKQLIDLVKQL